MKFTLSFVAAAAMLAVGTAAQQEGGDSRVDPIANILEPLASITGEVNALREAFTAYLGGDLTQTDNAVNVATELTTNLNQTAAFLLAQDYQGDSTDKVSLQIRQHYDFLKRNVTVVTQSLRKNVAAIDAVNARGIIAAVLPPLETGFDLLFDGVIKFVTPKYIESVGEVHRKLDNEMETTMRVFQLNDYSDDDNNTVDADDFPVPPPGVGEAPIDGGNGQGDHALVTEPKKTAKDNTAKDNTAKDKTQNSTSGTKKMIKTKAPTPKGPVTSEEIDHLMLNDQPLAKEVKDMMQEMRKQGKLQRMSPREN